MSTFHNLQMVEQTQLKISGLPPQLQRHELKQYLLEFGPVKRLFLSNNSQTSNFAYATFEDEAETYNASKHFNKSYFGEHVQLSIAKRKFKKQDKPNISMNAQQKKNQAKRQHQYTSSSSSSSESDYDPSKTRKLKEHWKKQQLSAGQDDLEEIKRELKNKNNKRFDIKKNDNSSDKNKEDYQYFISLQKQYEDLYQKEKKWMKSVVKIASEQGQISSDDSFRGRKKRRKNRQISYRFAEDEEETEVRKKSRSRDNKKQKKCHVGRSRQNSSLD